MPEGDGRRNHRYEAPTEAGTCWDLRWRAAVTGTKLHRTSTDVKGSNSKIDTTDGGDGQEVNAIAF